MRIQAIAEDEDASFGRPNRGGWCECQEKAQRCGPIDKLWATVNITKGALLVSRTRSASRNDVGHWRICGSPGLWIYVGWEMYFSLGCFDINSLSIRESFCIQLEQWQYL